MEGLEPAQGLALRGTSDAQLISGDGLRKLLVKVENRVSLDEPVCLPPVAPSQPVKGRQRASRRAATGAGNVVAAEARAQRVSRKLIAWDHDHVGPSLLQ